MKGPTLGDTLPWEETITIHKYRTDYTKTTQTISTRQVRLGERLPDPKRLTRRFHYTIKTPKETPTRSHWEARASHRRQTSVIYSYERELPTDPQTTKHDPTSDTVSEKVRVYKKKEN